MRVITRGFARKNVFKEIARLRSQDAAILLQNGRILGAVYLLGYSIECYLKYIICERHGEDCLPGEVEFPPEGKAKWARARLYTHDWAVLAEVAGILASIERQRDVHTRYLALCDQWAPDLRYRTKPFRKPEGEYLYNDLAQLYEFLKDLVP